MNKLWIVGDSYSSTEMFNHDRVWTNQLAAKLGHELKNMSVIGCSQDFLCQALLHFSKDISPDDQIIVVLTGSNRVWFFEDMPYVTHSDVKHMAETVGTSRAKAAELYFRYIQRPQLDILHTTLRLAWLNHMTVTHGWKKPLVIVGFQQDTGRCEYPDLMFSQGNLTEHVSQQEQVDPSAQLLIGHDPRYNHLCLKNHDVLTNKIYNTLVNNEPLDLTQGFHQHLLSEESLEDLEFAKNELCEGAYNSYKNSKKPASKWNFL